MINSNNYFAVQALTYQCAAPAKDIITGTVNDNIIDFKCSIGETYKAGDNYYGILEPELDPDINEHIKTDARSLADYVAENIMNSHAIYAVDITIFYKSTPLSNYEDLPAIIYVRAFYNDTKLKKVSHPFQTYHITINFDYHYYCETYANTLLKFRDALREKLMNPSLIKGKPLNNTHDFICLKSKDGPRTFDINEELAPAYSYISSATSTTTLILKSLVEGKYNGLQVEYITRESQNFESLRKNYIVTVTDKRFKDFPLVLNPNIESTEILSNIPMSALSKEKQDELLINSLT